MRKRPILSIEMDAEAADDGYTTVPPDTGMPPGART
jgi:hypothetical protein